MVNLFWLAKPQVIRSIANNKGIKNVQQNIFTSKKASIDFNYDSCAAQHHDAHVIKIALECTQLLYNAHHSNPFGENWKQNAPSTKTGNKGFKAFNLNNPISKWIRANVYHYRHAVCYGLALCKEYTHRYQKLHSCEPHLQWLKDNEPQLPEDVRRIESPPCAMPDQYKPAWLVLQQQKEKEEEVKNKQKNKKRKIKEVIVQAISKRRKKITTTTQITETSSSSSTEPSITTTTSIINGVSLTSSTGSFATEPAGSLPFNELPTEQEPKDATNEENDFYFSEDIYKAYRDYYLGEKLTVKMVRWTKRTIPDWIFDYAKKNNVQLKDLMTEEEIQLEKEKKNNNNNNKKQKSNKTKPSKKKTKE